MKKSMAPSVPVVDCEYGHETVSSLHISSLNTFVSCSIIIRFSLRVSFGVDAHTLSLSHNVFLSSLKEYSCARRSDAQQLKTNINPYPSKCAIHRTYVFSK
jgi:hypothetical protein